MFFGSCSKAPSHGYACLAATDRDGRSRRRARLTIETREYDSMRLATITTGSGPIKVGLVHGLGASGATWEPLIDRMLSDGRYTVIAVDLRGHGSSERAASYKLDDVDVDLGRDVERTSPLSSGSANAAAATLPISNRAELSGSSSSSDGAPWRSGPPQRPRRRSPARSPAAASASGATVVPSLVPARGSAAAGTVSRSRPPARRRRRRAHQNPATVAATCAWLIGPSPSRQASRATVPRSPPEPAPTTRRAAPTAAGRHRTRVPPSHPATAPRPARRDRSTPMFPTG